MHMTISSLVPRLLPAFNISNVKCWKLGDFSHQRYLSWAWKYHSYTFFQELSHQPYIEVLEPICEQIASNNALSLLRKRDGQACCLQFLMNFKWSMCCDCRSLTSNLKCFDNVCNDVLWRFIFNSYHLVRRQKFLYRDKKLLTTYACSTCTQCTTSSHVQIR